MENQKFSAPLFRHCHLLVENRVLLEGGNALKIYTLRRRGEWPKKWQLRARFPGNYGPTQQMGRKYSWHRFPVKTGEAKNIPTKFSPIYSIFQYPNPARICEFDRIPIFPPPPPLCARGFPSPLMPDISIFGFCIAAEVEEAIEFLPAILYGKLDDRINIFCQKKSTLLRVVCLPRIISFFWGFLFWRAPGRKEKEKRGVSY